MERLLLSRQRSLAWVLLAGALIAGLLGCAVGKEARLKSLQARSSYELGLSHLREGNATLGLTSLQEAVALDPDSALYRNALGRSLLLYDLKRVPEALEALREAVSLDPQFAEAHHNLGVALAESGRWGDAVQAYRKALSIPGYAAPLKTYNNLGWAYYNLDRLAEAEEALKTAIRLDPEFAGSHYHLGLVLLKAGRKDEARAAFLRARDLAPESEFGLAAREHLKALGASP
jgi:Tfp pilus assembly protein PilF